MKLKNLKLDHMNKREGSSENKTEVVQRAHKDIAIIGMSGMFPNNLSIEEFYDSLKSERDFIRSFPSGRKEDIDFYEKFRSPENGKPVYKKGAYFEEIDRFDPEFFDITPREAGLMDPVQRLFLDTVWEAVHDAGYTKKIKGSHTGVYAGTSNFSGNSYGQMILHMSPEEYDLAFTGNLPSALAGRIAYYLNLKGPCMLIDTACSSSLTAVYTACQALRSRECEMAIAGGIKILLMPFNDSRNLGIESADNKTHTFDEKSDGTGNGEGVMAFLLKPLEQAIADRDSIHAVIKGGAMNQDGYGMSLATPNVSAQEQLLIKAWEDAGVDPETIVYIEAHGTGTKLGDPIEIEAIHRAFCHYTQKRQFCAVGSVKSNIGHLDTAAGGAGLVKAVQILKERKIPSSIHFTHPNRKIDFIHSPVYVSDRLMSLESSSELLRCGVSSFGLSGSNCHIVLEEYRSKQERAEKEEAISRGICHPPMNKRRCWIPVSEKKRLGENQLLAGTHIAGSLDLDIWERRLRVEEEWRLTEHRIGKSSVLPGTAYLEIICQLSQSMTETAVEICNITLLNRFELKDGEEKILQTVTKHNGEAYDFNIISRRRDSDEWTKHAEGSFRFLNSERMVPPFNIDELKKDSVPMESDEEESKGLISFGLRWSNIKKRAKVSHGILIYLELEHTFVHDVEKSGLHAALLDNALNGAVPHDVGSIWLPMYYDSIKIYGKIGTSLYSLIKVIREGKDYIVYNVTLADEQGMVLAEISQYTVKKISARQLVEKNREKSFSGLYSLNWVEDKKVCTESAGDDQNSCGRLIFSNTIDMEKISNAGFCSNYEFADISLLSGSNYMESVVKIVNKETIPTVLYIVSNIEEDGMLQELLRLRNLIMICAGCRKKPDIVVVVFRNVDEEPALLHPFHSGVPAFLKSAALEYGELSIRCILADAQTDMGTIMDEVNRREAPFLTAYKNNMRYIQQLDMIIPHMSEQGETGVLKDKGLYVITGGLGGIGLAIAMDIAKKVTARIILTGRTSYGMAGIQKMELTEDVPWLTKEQQIIISEIRQMGSYVEYRAGDISDENRMKDMFQNITEYCGRIDGIIHAAGVPFGKLLKDMQDMDWETVWKPKIQGTLVLDRVTDGMDLDFILLFSSVAALTGGAGQSGYAYGNAFMDSLAGVMRRKRKNVRSIYWSTWEETGMAVYTETVTQNALFHPLKTEEAVNAFGLILNDISIQNVVVGALNEKRDYSASERLFGIRLSETIINNVFKPAKQLKLFDKERKRLLSKVRLMGRDKVKYTQMEETAGAIWAQELGFEELDITKDFYGMGGESILATKIVNHINEELKIKTNITDLFEHPTLEGFAGFIDQIMDDKSKPLIGMEPKLLSTDKHVEKDSKEYPLSSAQERIWFQQKLSKEMIAYHLPFKTVLQVSIRPDIMNQAYRKMIARHAILRTRFFERNGIPVQRVYDKSDTKLQYLDLCKAENGLEQAMEYIKEDNKKAFDLEKEVCRLILIRLNEKKYLFYFNIHHIVSDGWSTRIIYEEMLEVYNQLLEGREAELVPLQVDYFDWIREEKQWEDSPEYKQAKKYWLNELEKPLPLLSLPVDYQRPPVKTYNGGYKTSLVPKALVKRVKAMAGDLNITLNEFFMSVYYILLYKLTGEEDIILGLPKENRINKDYERVVGLFVNSLCIRINPKEGMDFKDLTALVKSKCLGAYKNSRYSFSTLVGILNPERDISRNPIFSTMFQFYDNIPQENEETVLDDMSLYLRNKGDDIECRVEYNRDLFCEDTVERFLSYYMNILGVIPASGEIRIKDIDIMSREERYMILQEFNHTVAPYPKHSTILDLFREQVRQHPNRIAIKCRDNSLTYEELWNCSCYMANSLHKKGVCEETVVGIMMERSAELIIAILAVQLCGGTYLPIDKQYPEERKLYMLDDSDAKFLLVCGAESREWIPKAYGGEVIDAAQASDHTGITEFVSLAKPEHLAYIIYTSGSTGTPKGVLIEHRALVNRLNWMQKKYPISEYDCILQKTNYTFDVSVWELFWYLMAGSSVYLLEPGGESNPAAIVNAIYEKQITVIHFVPSMLAVFFEYLESQKEVKKLESLKWIFSSGEALSASTVHKFHSLFEGNKKIQLVNLYGPTEAAIDVTYYDCMSKTDTQIPIGRPIDNIRILILNKDGQLSPVGVPGELYISGAGLARGYLNQPKLTDESFIPNPFYEPEDGVEYKRIYRTGDLSKWLADGNIAYLGRTDAQVKIRGYRIELGEIEAVLLSYTGINNAVVMEWDQKGKEKKLAAFLTADKGLDERNLRAYLAEKIPSYMVPAHIAFLDEIPVNKSGKADRKALLDYEFKTELKGVDAAADAYQKWMVSAFSELLGIEEALIGTESDFFELGGNSISSIQLHNRILSKFPIRMELMDIFTIKTVLELAEFIKTAAEQSDTEPKASEGLPLLKRNSYSNGEYYEASPNQKRIYVAMELEKNKTAYNMPVAYRLRGDVSPEKVEESFLKLLDRHDSLRMTFHMRGGTPVFKVSSFAIVANACFSYEECHEAHIKDWMEKFIIPFDLEHGPLIRSKLIKVKKDEYYFLLDMSHIISDGMSIHIILNDFFSFYSGKKLPSLPYHYYDYTLWQNQLRNSDAGKLEENYWMERFLERNDSYAIPADYTRTRDTTSDADSLTFFIENERMERMEEYAKQEDCTIFHLLFAVYNIILSYRTGSEDIIIGIPVSGRSTQELMNIVGLFFNTLAIRSRPLRDLSFREFLDQVKSNILKDFEYSEYPFDQLVERLNLRGENNRDPFINTMFLYQNLGVLSIEPEGIEVEKQKIDTLMVKFDLEVEVAEVNNKLEIQIKYCRDLFQLASMEALRDNIIAVLDQIFKSPEIRLNELKLSGFKKEEAIGGLINAFDMVEDIEFDF